MARSRNLKPGFFHNEYLVELPTETRLLFAGLPCIADRLGRLDDRPKKIKMQLFPADIFDVDVMLNDLQVSGFILRYEVSGNKYIQIINFLKHQHPHKDEKKSTIPEPYKHDANTVQQPDKHSPNPALTLNPSTLTLNPKEHMSDSDESDLTTKPKKKSAKKTQLPADWKPPLDYRDYCTLKRPELNVDLVAENFLDYYLSHGKPMADWKRTWQRWVRNERGNQKANGISTPQSRGREATERYLAESSNEVLETNA